MAQYGFEQIRKNGTGSQVIVTIVFMEFHNFAAYKNRLRIMGRHRYIPEEIYDDEAVIFIAERHHTTPRQMLQCFLEQEHPSSGSTATSLRLEDNEVAILRDMIENNH